MDYNDYNPDNINDELNNNSSSSLHSNNFVSGLKSGFNAQNTLHNQADIDAIKNRTGKNEQNTRPDDTEKDDNKTNALEKKDELNDNKNEKNNENTNNKETTNNKKHNIDSSKKINAKTDFSLKSLFKKLPLNIKIIIIASGAVLIAFAMLYFILSINSFTTSISIANGIKEAEIDGEKTSSNQLFLYTDNGPVYQGKDLTELSWEELNKALELNNVCNVGNALSGILDAIYGFFTGGEFRDSCQLIRFIKGSINKLEERYLDYNLQMDTGLILATIFFGYDQQATYSSYEDPSNVDFFPAGKPYDTLQNIVEGKDSQGNAILTKDHVMRIIESTIFEELYPDFTFGYSIEKNRKGEKIIVGYCQQTNNQFYYNSLTKWEIFARFNDDEEDNPNPNNNPLFGMSGYMRSKSGSNKKVLNKDVLKLRDNDEFLSLTGAGFVYDTNMNLAFESTDVPCNGSLDKGEFEQFLFSLCSDCVDAQADRTFDNAYNFFIDRNIKGIIDTTLYTQHIEDPDLPGKDTFQSVPRTFSVWTGSKATAQVEPATARAEFDYLKGFMYKNFPGFEDADNNPNLPNFKRDEILSPKKIETIIEEIKQRKEEFNEILYVDENGRPTRIFSGMYYVDVYGNPVLVPSESFYPKTLYYCEYIYGGGTVSNQQIAGVSVNLTDCEGNRIGTTSFKDYILGVTYGEIVISSADDDLILTQMVASMSYALSRRSNENTFQNGSITMKSGSCDQNWCDVYNGCVRRTGSSGYQSSIPGNGDRPALSSSTITRLNNLYEIASQYLLLDSNGDIYNAGYTTSRHEKWEDMANQGMNFVDILSQTYTNAVPIDCVIINDNKNNSITDGIDIPQNIVPPTADQTKWGQMIVEKAMEFYEKYNEYFRYMSPSDAEALSVNPRVLGYNGQTFNGYYQADCNSFISLVLNKALGIGTQKASSVGDFQFVRPDKNSGQWVSVRDNVKQIATGLSLSQALQYAQPGDILGSVGDGSTHVQIYAGNGVVIDNANANSNAPFSLRTVNGHPETGKQIRHQKGTYTILRVDNLK